MKRMGGMTRNVPTTQATFINANRNLEKRLLLLKSGTYWHNQEGPGRRRATPACRFIKQTLPEHLICARPYCRNFTNINLFNHLKAFITERADFT